MRLKTSAVAIGLATALAVTACTSSTTDDPTPDATDSPSAEETTEPTDDGSATQGTAALTIAKPDGALTVESNNPWIGDSSALKLGYVNAIYEPVAFVNTVNPDDPIRPWLASEIEWADDYRSVTLTARDGVLWNDGTPFTAEDIEFTYTLLKDNPAIENQALGITDVALDGDRVTVSFENSVFVKQDKVLHKYIVPKHVWEGVADVTTEVNLDPVGTGPYVLSNWTTQSVELTARDDYWGGALAVPTLYYVSYNDNTALTTALANGDADWAQAWIPNVQSAFIDKDPEHNVYWAPAGLGVDAMFVNTTKKPFDDVVFRQAVNMVVDRGLHQAIAREGGVPLLTSITGLPTPVGDAFISPEFQGVEYVVDVDGARALLEANGYTYDGDTLVDPDGEVVTFALQVPQGWSDYVTGISLISESVKAIGVEAQVLTPDVDSWWGDKGTGDFDAILHWTDTGATPYDLYNNMMDGRWLQPIGESADYNFGRFDSPEATAALNDFANAVGDGAEGVRAEALATIQSIFVEEVPAMPIGTRPFIGQYNTRHYVGWPDDSDPYANPDPTQPIAVLILTSLSARG